MSNNIIKVGSSFHIYDSPIETFSQLPQGTFRVEFSPTEGFKLIQVPDIEPGSEKVYGNHDKKVNRILNAYRHMSKSRSLGAMMSGDKGMGKSLMLRMLSKAAREELGLPTIIVDTFYPGIAAFLDKIGPSVMLFDEFEKVFSSDDDDDNRQSQFLSLFDGTSSCSRIYALSVNNLGYVSDYIVNRPGRFHYHIRFDYPDAEEIGTYLRDHVSHVSDKNIESVVNFSKKVNINYDHLRAIAYELATTDEPFESIIGDLNIKRDSSTPFTVTAVFNDGTTMEGTSRLDIFERSSKYVSMYGDCTEGSVTFDPSKHKISTENGIIEVTDGITWHVSDNEDEDLDIDRIQLRLRGQRQISF